MAPPQNYFIRGVPETEKQPRLCIDVLRHFARFGIWRAHRKLHSRFDLSVYCVLNLAQHRGIREPLGDQLLSKNLERIVLCLPFLLFRLRTIVFPADITDMMSVITVCFAF